MEKCILFNLQYIPTPIKELEKRGIFGEEENIQESEGGVDEDNDRGDSQEGEVLQENDQQQG